MTPETAELVRNIQAGVAIVGAVVGVVGSAVGTVIGTKIGQRWLEKSQDHLRQWVSDLDHKSDEHERRLSTVEGICEATRNKGRC